jgi:hypothetical protein
MKWLATRENRLKLWGADASRRNCFIYAIMPENKLSNMLGCVTARDTKEEAYTPKGIPYSDGILRHRTCYIDTCFVSPLVCSSDTGGSVVRELIPARTTPSFVLHSGLAVHASLRGESEDRYFGVRYLSTGGPNGAVSRNGASPGEAREAGSQRPSPDLVVKRWAARG